MRANSHQPRLSPLASPRLTNGAAVAAVRAALRAALLAVLPAVLLAVPAACGRDGTGPAPRPISPAPSPATFAEVLDSIRREDALPALGAAIVSSDSVLRLDVTGVRRLGGSAAVTRDDKWHLGSVLKHQTAVLVASLVHDGTLSWTSTLADYFPELASTMRAEYRPRTLRDLLSHTSALPRDYSAGFDATGRVAREAAVRWAMQAPPVGAPGTYAYSNVGYMVAGAIVERALGRDFEQVMTQRLWGKLDMTRAGFGQAGTPGLDDEPLGHHLTASGTRTTFGAGAPNADNPPEYGPAGRAHMPLGDWGRFVAALLAAERGRDTPVLPSREWRALTGSAFVPIGNDGYGYGLVIAQRNWADGRALFHDGTNTRHYALVGIAPDRDFAILIATNQWSPTMGATMDRIFGRLASYQRTGR